MTISSINSNTAAILAQLNISTGTQNTSNDVAALSSGNRIVSAATDVAALAAGTGLASQVNVLNSSISVAAQGSSLLQVADGGLAQIQSILQRQQAITTSAESGSLSSAQLGFLDQEFQALTTEINNIANQTNFNGVSLLNGGIAGADSLQTANLPGQVNSVSITGTVANSQIASVTAGSISSDNDTTLYGELSGGKFTVTTGTGTDYDISYSINGSTYSVANIVGTASQDITLTNGAGDINITLAATALGGSTSTTNATLQTSLTNFFANADAFATRQIRTSDATSATTGAIITNSSIAAAATGATSGTDSTNGTGLQGFTGANVTISSDQYNGVAAPSISGFTATTSGTTLDNLSVTVNGQTYTTGNYTGGQYAAAATGVGSSAGNFKFYLNGNTASNDYINLNLSGISATGYDLTTANGTTGLVNALNSVFGGGGSGLTFQVGTNASDTIGVSLGSATSSALFNNVSQNVLTQASATTAAAAVATALNTVTSLRATVGANEEQFNFASTALSSAAQNEGAAESNLLDTDVSATSTTFATNQVQLQAGIAVLAQANQLQQNLLKLIS